MDSIQSPDVNRRDRAGNTPLHVAAYGGHALIVEQLLARGANRTLRNQAGFTPAELASEAEKADPKTKPPILALLERADAQSRNGP
jgi:ankyrin repeat protein